MNNKLFRMVLTAMFTAMIFVLTRFIAIPVAAGYVHLGDAFVYIVATLIGGPWAFFAAAVGEALADLTSGWAVYAPVTIIVKCLIAIPFVLCYKKNVRILTLYTALMTIPAGLITVGGYFAADLIINKAYAYVNITGNVIQAAASTIIFIISALALDSLNIKKKYFNNRM